MRWHDDWPESIIYPHGICSWSEFHSFAPGAGGIYLYFFIIVPWMEINRNCSILAIGHHKFHIDDAINGSSMTNIWHAVGKGKVRNIFSRVVIVLFKMPTGSGTVNYRGSFNCRYIYGICDSLILCFG